MGHNRHTNKYKVKLALTLLGLFLPRRVKHLLPFCLFKQSNRNTVLYWPSHRRAEMAHTEQLALTCIRKEGLHWKLAFISLDLFFWPKQHMFVYLDIAIEEQPIGTLLFEVSGWLEQQKQGVKIPNIGFSLPEGREAEIWTADISYEFHIFPLMLILQLFSDVCPKTCENFRALCEGGVMSPSSGQELTYKNSCFHRLVKPVWIQGGGAFPNVLSKSGSQHKWDGMTSAGYSPSRCNQTKANLLLRAG